MNKLLRKFSQLFLLLWYWKFFQFAQTLANGLFPSSVLRMKKSVFYRYTQAGRQSERNNESIKIWQGDKQAVGNMVRDLYGNDPKTLEFYEDFFNRGFEPWIAQQGETVVGVVWLFSDSYLTMWEGYDAYLLRLHVAPGAKFFGNVFVSPQLRGQGLFTLIARHCFTAYPDVEFYSTVDESNIPSIISHEKIGFQLCGAARYIRFFQWTFCIVTLKQRRIQFYRLQKGVETEIFLER